MAVGQLFLCQPKYMINNCQKLKSGQNPLGYTNGRKAVADHVDGEVYITYTNIVLNGDEMSGTMSNNSTSINFKAKRQ